MVRTIVISTEYLKGTKTPEVTVRVNRHIFQTGLSPVEAESVVKELRRDYEYHGFNVEVTDFKRVQR